MKPKLTKVDWEDPKYWVKEAFLDSLRVERNDRDQVVICYTLETEDKQIPISEFEEHIGSLPEYLQEEARSILPLLPKAISALQKMIED